MAHAQTKHKIWFAGLLWHFLHFDEAICNQSVENRTHILLGQQTQLRYLHLIDVTLLSQDSHHTAEMVTSIASLN